MAWTTLDQNNLLAGEPLIESEVLALYENPIAIAEGAAGAPRVRGTARNHNKLGEVTATSDVTEIALTDLPAHNDIIIVCEELRRTGTEDTSISVALQISDNNGSSWVSLTSINLFITSYVTLMRVFTGWSNNLSFRIGTNLERSQLIVFQGALFSFSGQVNAVRIARTIGNDTIGIGSKLEVYALAEGYLP